MGFRTNTTNNTTSGWLLAAPAVLGLTLFMLTPFLVALALSFTNYRLNSPLPLRWTGVNNYQGLFSNPVFLRAILNSVLFAIVVVPLQTALALMLAILVNQRLKGVVVFRTIFFLPVIYPIALVSVVWGLIFAPEPTALMNQAIDLISLGSWNEQTDFLRHRHLAFPAIMVMSIWQGVGFQMVILLAALQSVPEMLYEAARIDGAGRWARFWNITLPELRNSLIFVVMVTTILAFRLFDQVWILTQGGPNNTTTTVMYEIFLASRERNQIGLASAMTIVFFLIVGSLTLAMKFGLRQRKAVG